MLLKCFIAMVFTSPLPRLCKISSPFRENSNEVVFPFSLQIFGLLANLLFIYLQGQFPILRRRRSYLDLCPLIRPMRRPFSLGNGMILFSGLIQPPPTLTFLTLSTFFRQEVQVGIIPSLNMRTNGISHTSLVFQRVYM